MPSERGSFRRILVPFDDADQAGRALAEAMPIARLAGGEVRLLSVFDEARYVSGFEPAAVIVDEIVPRARHDLDEALGKAAERLRREGVACSVRVVDAGGTSVASRVIQESEAWGADLLVVGSHVRRGVDRALLGSVAEDIVRGSPVPVLVVRAAHDLRS